VALSADGNAAVVVGHGDFHSPYDIGGAWVFS
jgi:hypothetical protein